ncbi:MAG: hemolysin III family protein [Lachnospiraceae bacterium]|nr:hemolysin III family protein [Lachnospiraceae bacterium]
MKRTKLKDRKLPDYTKGEEIFNMVSHIVGGGFGVVALVLCIIMAAVKGNALGVICSIVYGITLIDLYTMSSIYHGLKPGMAKKVMQVIDHCTIYFLIAGSYTPVLLVKLLPMYPAIAWSLFALVWGCAIVACTLTAIDLKKYNVFSMICYLAMGWCIIFFIRQTFQVMTFNGGMLLLLGGIAYTIGAVLYGVGVKKRYMHSVFHLFIILGSVLHFFAIFLYALPIK